MNMNHAELYFELRGLVDAFPTFGQDGDSQKELRLWAGKVAALIEDLEEDEFFQTIDSMLFNAAASGSSSSYNHRQMFAIAARYLSRLERRVPQKVRGGFIPTGGEFAAAQVISNIFGDAKESIILVDPYASAAILTDFAVLAPEGVVFRVLVDGKTVKPDLKPTLERFRNQFGETRPIEVRKTASNKLHDRSIIVDQRTIFQVGQSFKDLAARSPTTISEIVELEIRDAKLRYYLDVWNSSKKF